MYTRISQDFLKQNLYYHIHVPLKTDTLKNQEGETDNDCQNVGDLKAAKREWSDGTGGQNTATRVDNSK